MEVFKRLNFLLARPLIGIIWIYQRTLSPDHGLMKVYYPYGYCKFYPSCSEYGRQMLLNKGFIGFPKIIKRIISCRPNAKGGVDLPI